ncbi:MFS transporter [Mycobacterium sp. 21AC1]|uniref:MFS transporter n=1 Tax=[Mycobacterium] appelbergii TaxID=2939269 RepID=UPI0029392B58|nr:MFS transporter [Mycobacterium sp. 21AC1]MDV3128942.1 MFS transporter [Mycobacterium sp. 21AC1]
MSSAVEPPTPREVAPQRAETADVRRAVVAASIGNFVEWFDFGFYGYLAATLSVVFFPSDNPTTGLLATFAVFGAAFVMRPLGAIYFGSVGDRIGRNRVLAVTVLAMSAATFAVGLLPTYSAIGMWAPLLLLALRMIQGFAAGGEPGGAATFLAEYSPAHRRGFTVSFWHFSSFAALICSAGLTLCLFAATTDAQMQTWGWRIPFLIALPAGVIGLYLRLRIDDTPEFRRLERAGKSAKAPLREGVSKDLRPMLQTFFLAALQQFGFYTVFVYIAIYVVAEADQSSGAGSFVTIVAVTVAMAIVSPAGALSDKVGRKPVLAGSCIAMAALAWPMLTLLTHSSLAIAVLAAAVLAVPLAMFMGAAGATLPEMFPSARRYSGMSLSFGLASAAFGGTAPYLATWMIAQTSNPLAPAYLLAGAAVISFIATLSLRETAGLDLSTIGSVDR